MLQELVAQFLAHDGYVETARAFTEEVATEAAALQTGQREPLKKYEVEEDREAINRNSTTPLLAFPSLPSLPLAFSSLTLRSEIRAAILDGDIDKALKHTKAYYANVLEDNPQIHFKLRCRKFLEMMRRSNELTAGTSDPKRRRADSPGLGIADEHAVFDQEMELDDGTWDGDGMDTEEPTAVAFNEVLTEAVQYGQQLCMDYPSDENGGDKKMLEAIFSLVAYPDPQNSVHGHYLDPAGRVAVAEELNSAILGVYFSAFLMTLLPLLALIPHVVTMLIQLQSPSENPPPPPWSDYTSKQRLLSTRSAKTAAPGRSSMFGMTFCYETIIGRFKFSSLSGPA